MKEVTINSVRHTSHGARDVGRQLEATPRTWSAVLRDGAIAGFLGAMAVAIWFLIFDTIRGRPFLTPMLLGELIMHAPSVIGGHPLSPALPIIAGPVLAYSAIHFIGFMLFGIAIAALLYFADAEPLMGFGVLLAVLSFEILFVGIVTVLDMAVLRMLGEWTIIFGNLLALALMGWYFHSHHPALLARLRRRWNSTARGTPVHPEDLCT
ncbi:MAG: hypothetical protein IVW54_11045 [Candidatus Binataceae bacterium]|nr:hypothetical protein [Candidatus Binataceae bacterium]